MRLVLLVVAASFFGGCTMLTSFNPEDQPCDLSAPVESQCLDGFHCVDSKCKRGSADAGQ